MFVSDLIANHLFTGNIILLMISNLDCPCFNILNLID